MTNIELLTNGFIVVGEDEYDLTFFDWQIDISRNLITLLYRSKPIRFLVPPTGFLITGGSSSSFTTAQALSDELESNKSSYGGGTTTSGGGVSVSFDENIPFNRDYSIMNHIINAPLGQFVPITSGAIPWGGTAMRLVSDGVNQPSFHTSFYRKGDAWDNTVGRVHDLMFIYNGSEYEVAISQGATISLPDTTAPTIISRNTTSGTVIRLAGSEILNFTSSAGFSAKIGASLGAAVNLPISSASGSGTSNIDLTVGSTINPGDGLWVSYNSTTGNVVDAGTPTPNPLASFTDQVVTNNNVATGLTNEYLMEEATGATRMDTVGTAHLTQVGGVTKVAGKVGFAAQFTGVQRLTTNAFEPHAPGGHQPWTINFWIKPISLPGSDCVVFVKMGEFGIYILGSGQIRASITTGSAGDLWDKAWATGVAAGVWTMKTLVITGTALNLYTDGALDNGSNVAGGGGNIANGTRYIAGNTLTIGEAGSSTNNPDFVIDQMRGYNTALNLVEIQNLFNGGTGN